MNLHSLILKFLITSFVVSSVEVVLPEYAHSYSINDYYNICLYHANKQGCGSLGVLCGRGNRNACSLLNDITIRGYNRVRWYCNRRSRQACNFISTVDAIGVMNLGRACGRGNTSACDGLELVRCFATESATGNYCSARFTY